MKRTGKTHVSSKECEEGISITNFNSILRYEKLERRNNLSWSNIYEHLVFAFSENLARETIFNEKNENGTCFHSHLA